MALTEEEKKLTRAYNIGYMLSIYEPRLLESIIKNNPRNDFVKAMRIGKDHREFHANIPRKDYNPDFKNGFYNGRALAENDRDVLNRVLNSKGISKSYRKGLEAAKLEFDIKGIHTKMDNVPKQPRKDLITDRGFKHGFNVGYRLAEDYAAGINHIIRLNDDYSKYVDGIKAGKQQYEFDLSATRAKDGDNTIFKPENDIHGYEQAAIEDKLARLNELSSQQSRMVNQHKGFENVPLPKWLKQDDAPTKDSSNQPKKKNRDNGLDR